MFCDLVWAGRVLRAWSRGEEDRTWLRGERGRAFFPRAVLLAYPHQVTVGQGREGDAEEDLDTSFNFQTALLNITLISGNRLGVHRRTVPRIAKQPLLCPRGLPSDPDG